MPAIKSGYSDIRASSVLQQIRTLPDDEPLQRQCQSSSYMAGRADLALNATRAWRHLAVRRNSDITRRSMQPLPSKRTCVRAALSPDVGHGHRSYESCWR